ncbi:imelysin family protein [Roseomonas sp. 18066]|uniref:imelysin family protein n=1 Tax=Roseomonas sp. 18066 TaxID=2681412 RepID=UPI00135C753E|nr:imelysin family protein [Roseomonas sp. 18066]
MSLSRRSALTLTALLLAPLPAAAAPDEAACRALNRAAVEQVLLPAYRRFAAATANLAARLDTLARTPAEDASLNAAREGFAEAFLTWQAVQHLRFGPADLFSRHERIQFWPDPRNAIGRDLAAAIAGRDTATLEARPNALGQVTTQGLPALERLLQGDEAVARLRAGDAEAGYRAALLRAIGGNLATLAQDLLAGWTGGEQPFGRVLVEPRSPYATPREATLELFKALYSAIEVVADRKLSRPLGSSPSTSRMQLLEAWRSGLSGQAIQANIIAARALWSTAFAPAVQASDAELAALLTRAFDQVNATAAGLPLPLETDFGIQGRRDAALLLQKEAAALKLLLSTRLPPVLDIPLGFNALDGD